MTIDLATLAVIGSSLATAIIYLIKWIRDASEKERTTLLARAERAEKELDEAQTEINSLQAKRLEDSREYGAAVADLSHRFRQAVHAVANWTRRR